MTDTTLADTSTVTHILPVIPWHNNINIVLCDKTVLRLSHYKIVCDLFVDFSSWMGKSNLFHLHAYKCEFAPSSRWPSERRKYEGVEG